MSVNTFMVIGSPTFNNYWYLRRQLDVNLSPGATLAICGRDRGTDAMVRVYAARHNLYLEEYRLQDRSVESYRLRNKNLIKCSRHHILFVDGSEKAGTVRDLLEDCKKFHVTPIVIRYPSTENIDLRRTLLPTERPISLWLQMLNSRVHPSEEDLGEMVEDLMVRDDLKEDLRTLGKEHFVACNEPKLDGMILWLVQNAKCDICGEQPKKEAYSVRLEKRQAELEALYEKWTKRDHYALVSTNRDFAILLRYRRVVRTDYAVYLEALDNDIIHDHIWKKDEEQDEDSPVEKYIVKDSSNTDIFMRIVEFDDNFRKGFWYVNVKTLKD